MGSWSRRSERPGSSWRGRAMNTRSLSFRLVTWYASLLLVVFVLLGALTLIFLRHYL